jgi:hypothetical protein
MDIDEYTTKASAAIAAGQPTVCEAGKYVMDALKDHGHDVVSAQGGNIQVVINGRLFRVGVFPA